MESNLKFNSTKFNDWSEKPEGKKVWKMLQEHDNLIRLTTHADLGRPPAEAVSGPILQAFPALKDDRRFKQMVGFMIGEILRGLGYVQDGRWNKTRGGFFSVAMRFKKA